MATFKLVLGFKNGSCFQREVKEADAAYFLGKKVGDKVQGSHFGLEGYEFLISGGSDHAGFPMRRDVGGAARKRIFAVEGIGLKKRGKGVKYRFTVAGNTVHEKTAQINLKVLKEGKEKFEAPKKEEEKKEAKVEEKKEEVKEEKVEKKKEVKEEKTEAPKVEMAA